MPTFLRRLRARIKYWNNAEELKKELDAHREMATAAFSADGTPLRESRWKAARLLGNDTLAREDSRAVWVARWIEQLGQDLRYSLRTLRREWGFAITATITLSLGLGVLIGVFTVFSAVFLRPWPVTDPDRVFGVTTSLIGPPAKDGYGPIRRISFPVWKAIAPEMTTSDLVINRDYGGTIRTSANGRPRNSRVALVSDTFLTTLGLKLEFGGLNATGDMPGIAITYALWQNDFGGARDVLGRTVWLDKDPVVVTGVLDRRFRGFPPRPYDGVMLLSRAQNLKPADLLVNPKACCIEVFGRLRPGATREAAAAEIAGRANAMHSALGMPAIEVAAWDTTMAGRPRGIEDFVPRLFALLFTGCGIVTLLCCANIGNLQLARGLRRSREVSVRLSLGAGRSRIVRQLMTESAVVAAMGLAGALLLAWKIPSAIMTADGEMGMSFTPDGRVIGFATLLAALATILAGLAPALRITRIEWKHAGATVVAGAGPLRNILLGAQIALSLSLIASASLLARGAQVAASGAGAGFEFESIDVAVLAVTSKSPSYSGQANAGRRQEIASAVASIPGIGLVDAAPWSTGVRRASVVLPGREGRVDVQWSGLGGAAMDMLKIPIVGGRQHSDDPRVHEAMISRSMARILWGAEEPVGRTFSTAPDPAPFAKEPDGQTYSVVGVIDEVRLVGPLMMPAFVTAPNADAWQHVLVRHSDGAQLAAVVAAIDPTIRILRQPLISGLRKQFDQVLIGISIASGLATVALLLASFGVFGVFAYIVEERRREIGVRLALGANRSQVRGSIVAATRWPVAGGLAAGMALAITGGLILRSNLFGLSVLDPLSYLMVAAILGIAAAAATAIPLRRALRVDPAITLRQE